MLEAFESFKKPFGGRLENSRREARENVEDGTVEINGQTFPVHDWSARAFMAKPCDVDCKITDRIDIKFSIRFPTKRIEFVSRAIVVRIDKQRQELAAHFAMLDEEAQLAIADHFGDGSMTRVAATASPPEPAPAAPQQPEARLAEERRKDGEARRLRLQYRLDEARRKREDETSLPDEKRKAEEARLAVERRNADSEDNEPVAPETEKQAEGGDSDADGEVLELTQMVREDGTTIDISEEPMQSDDDKATPKATGADKPKESPPVDEGPLVGGTAADASVKARAELNLVAEAAEPKPLSPAIGDQGRTIEDMVMESLKPMLRDWLDTNLPILVERLVEKEIRRLVRRAEPD